MKNTTKTILIVLLVVYTAGPVVLANPQCRSHPGFQNMPAPPGMQPDNFGGCGFGPGGQENFGRPGPGGQFERGGPQGPGEGLPILHLLRALNLTEEQQEQVKAILDESKDEMKTAREEAREAMQSLNGAVMDGADANDIKTAAETVKQAIVKEALVNASAVRSIKNKLTEEQLQQLKKLRDEAKQQPANFQHQGPHGLRMGPMQDRPPGPMQYGYGPMQRR